MPGTSHQMPQGSAKAARSPKGMTSRSGKKANSQWGIRKGESDYR